MTSPIVKDFLLALNNPLNFLTDFSNAYSLIIQFIALYVPSVIISMHLNWFFYHKLNFASKE